MTQPATTHEYIDAIKARYGVESDYRVSQLLGISRSLMSSYRKGRSRFDDSMAIRVAEILDLEPGEVMANIHAERAQDKGVAEAWRKVAEACRRSAAASAPVILSAFFFAGAGMDSARATTAYDAERGIEPFNTSYTLCALMRAVRGFVRRLLEALEASADSGLAEA